MEGTLEYLFGIDHVYIFGDHPADIKVNIEQNSPKKPSSFSQNSIKALLNINQPLQESQIISNIYFLSSSNKMSLTKAISLSMLFAVLASSNPVPNPTIKARDATPWAITTYLIDKGCGYGGSTTPETPVTGAGGWGCVAPDWYDVQSYSVNTTDVTVHVYSDNACQSEMTTSAFTASAGCFNVITTTETGPLSFTVDQN